MECWVDYLLLCPKNGLKSKIGPRERSSKREVQETFLIEMSLRDSSRGLSQVPSQWHLPSTPQEPLLEAYLGYPRETLLEASLNFNLSNPPSISLSRNLEQIIWKTQILLYLSTATFINKKWFIRSREDKKVYRLESSCFPILFRRLS